MTAEPERAPSTPLPAGQVFVSYSHRDEAWKDAVVRYLGVLQVQGKLAVWEDRQLAAGDDWRGGIEAALALASVGLLLVSQNSLTSEFILRSEVPELLRRRASQGLHLIPVILRPCAWREVDWLAAIKAFPRDGVPLSTLDEAQVDTALALLARDVHRLISRAADGTSGSGTPTPVPHLQGIDNAAALFT
ncbi:MAG: toll/interleukin-1 receptor domain-containing protein [Gaiellaceae bacterium]